jgi:CubicO group peptidase (beta-lactamase class C family)
MTKKYSDILAGFMVGVLGFLVSFSLQAEQVAFDQLEKMVRQEAADKKLPMISLILVDESGVVWSYALGKDAQNPHRAADENTTYRIGSVSKLFTDIAVMQMVEKGLLDLDKPVQTYLPDFAPENPSNKPITLRQLMSHESGLVREPPVGNYFDPNEPSLAETVLSLNKTKLVYEPGSKAQYSNAGIAVVGRVLEVVSGQPFVQILKKNTLNPMGMEQSAFEPTAPIVKNLPEAYMWSYQGDRSAAPTFELGISPAGCMFSTTSDLAKFISTLVHRGEGLNGRLIDEDTLEQMWTPQSSNASARNRSFGIGFGLGELDGERSVSHGGAIYGFATQLKVLPDQKIGVAVATNLDVANGVASRIADYALRTLMAKQNGQPLPSYTASRPIPDSTVEKIVGFYEFEGNTIEVRRRMGDLHIERVLGLSLRLREIGDRIVIDDPMTFSDNIEFGDGTVKVFEKAYSKVADVQAYPPNASWSGLLGDYGYDHNVLTVSEKFGKLHVLIEWGMQYSMIDLGNEVFKFPALGLYPNEQLAFVKDSKGEVTSVSLNGIKFDRRGGGK